MKTQEIAFDQSKARKEIGFDLVDGEFVKMSCPIKLANVKENKRCQNNLNSVLNQDE